MRVIVVSLCQFPYKFLHAKLVSFCLAVLTIILQYVLEPVCDSVNSVKNLKVFWSYIVCLCEAI